MSDANLHLEVQKKDLSTTRALAQPLSELGEDEVRLRVERFALTANNVTYAVTGDMLGYWSFFPAEAGWGRVPAMGFAEVVASRSPRVSVGGRYYGWYPMSRYVEMKVAATGDGLRDEGEHRAPHAPIYRAYLETERDPFYEAGEEAEDRHALLRALFLTGFLADDFLADHGYYGASRVLVLSASSKTGIAFAERAAARGLAELVGVTSRRNLAFVSGLGCFDRSVAYEEIESLPADADAVVIDLSGDGGVLARVHAHLDARLRHSMAVGLSHHDARPPPAELRGPSPEFFFAPDQVRKRVQDWGPEGYRKRLAAALREFVAGSRGWLQVHRSHGADAAAATWRMLLAGDVPPSAGHVVSLWEAR